MRKILTQLFALILCPFLFIGNGQTVPSSDEAPYVGGRGLITATGPTEMFINPTSGTLGKDQFTVQACTGVFPRGNSHLIATCGIAEYGLTDWLELGAQGLIASADPHEHFQALGPQVRVRLLRDEDGHPEVSMGAMTFEGDSQLVNRTWYAAAFKRFPIARDGLFRSVGAHGGFRMLWQDGDFNTDGQGNIVYGGGELELPKHIFLVSEVSNTDDVYNRIPFSFGIQVRSSNGANLSLAGMQNGSESRTGYYIGVGINFQ